MIIAPSILRSDHYNQLTKAYWAIFSLIYVCAILILAVGSYNLLISQYLKLLILSMQVRTYTLDTLPFDYKILWNAGEYRIEGCSSCINTRKKTVCRPTFQAGGGGRLQLRLRV